MKEVFKEIWSGVDKTCLEISVTSFLIGLIGLYVVLHVFT